MKRILITAGGTATAWHIVNQIKENFAEKFEIHVCDINPRELVAASVLCDFYHKVPEIKSEGYYEYMLQLLIDYKIDIIIPLIDFDLLLFNNDNYDLIKNNITSTAPSKESSEICLNKENMANYFRKKGVLTPQIFNILNVKNNESYIIKPKIGFGSRNVQAIMGSEIPEMFDDTMIIQEKCSEDNKEITAEVFYINDKMKIFCRERIETKEGVCTKAKPVFYPEINEIINKISRIVDLPVASCMQFMRNKGKWNIIDCNLRLGAGTALSTAFGFKITKALLMSLLDISVSDDVFEIDKNIKSVVRVYKEEVIK